MACRYFMAPRHWQIAKVTRAGRRYGRTEPVAIGEVPRRVLKTALRAASLIGDGFYGVDLKTLGREVVVIEVNDNPSFNEGDEDRVAGEAFYETLVQHFVDELDRRRQGPSA